MVEYRSQVQSELVAICRDLLDLLEETLIPQSEEKKEAQVFYLKMAADYYRYLCEPTDDDAIKQKAAMFYGRAYALSESELKPTNPIRLGLALNYSVCFYEILKDQKKACDLAKKAFDEAISKLDKLQERDYKDSTLIMQLLRDNLTLWTSATGNGDDDEPTIPAEDSGDDDA